MGVSVFHLVFLFDKEFALLVSEFGIGPSSVGVTALAETRLGLESVVLELRGDSAREFRLIDSLELDFLHSSLWWQNNFLFLFSKVLGFTARHRSGTAMIRLRIRFLFLCLFGLLFDLRAS